MPSLTRDPITWPARQTSAVLVLPSARLAPKTASAISTGQVSGYPGATNAETTSGPTGSCSRFATSVLAQAISLAWSAGLSRA
jgi:hypothetical protein